MGFAALLHAHYRALDERVSAVKAVFDVNSDVII